MSSVRNLSLAPQSTGDTQHNVHDAALCGASLAFSKPSVQPKPQVNTYTGADNGALLAATRVGAPLQRDRTGSSSRSIRRPSTSPSQDSSKNNSSNSLVVPEDQFDRNSSPSSIAARLAAARHSPLRPGPQPVSSSAMSEQTSYGRDALPPVGSVGSVVLRLESQRTSQQPRRRDSPGISSTGGTVQTTERDEKPTDETPIPPTTSLVKMFEQNRPNTSSTRSTSPLMKTVQTSPPPVRSPKPQRAFKLPLEPKDNKSLDRTRPRTPPPLKAKPQHRMELPRPMQVDSATDAAYFPTQQQGPTKSLPIKQKPGQLAATRKSTPSPKPDVQRGKRQTRPLSEDNSGEMSMHRRLSISEVPPSPSSFKSAKEEQDMVEKLKPALPPPRRSSTRAVDSVPTTTRVHPTEPISIKSRNQSQNPSAICPSGHISPTLRPASARGGPSSLSVYHNNYQRESAKEITKHMTGESLSSAIVGAALAATSRNASPAPRSMSIEPLFPPNKKHHHLPFHRSPSPQKQSPPKTNGKLRSTLRKEPSSEEDTDEMEKYKKKGTRIMGIRARKHPHKHHEAARRRWRDKITDAERKRYEGLWAANKGLYLPTAQEGGPASEEDPSSDVLNLLVREIWTRSRLPIHVLEEVWDLVDGRGLGRLTRYEFVAGLWLIDQRLKGRKLPVKISDSVWQSAKGIGLKVRNPH